MTTLGFIVFAILMAAAPLGAQTIPVRSGEHDGFTRLVLPIPKDAKWTMDQADRSLSLKIGGPQVTYDISQVFSRISRERLKSLRQKNPGAALIFSLGCDCSAASFVVKSGFLVIDIRDVKPTPARLADTRAVPLDQPYYRYSPPEIPGVAVNTFRDKFPAKLGQVTLRELPPTPPLPEPQTLPANNRYNSPGNINLSEKRLISQIIRATNQGVLNSAGEPFQATIAVQLASDELGKSPPPRPEEEVSPPVALSATTIIDQGLRGVSDAVAPPSMESGCVEDEKLAISNWGGEQPFSVEVGKLRSGLFAEFDVPKPAMILDLARLYIFYGFGAEARQLVNWEQLSGEEPIIINALADIIDSGRISGENPFADQQSCDSDVALWSLLSSENIARNANDNSILKAFSRLPLHLRVSLSPGVIRKYTDIGNVGMAESLLRTLSRTGVASGPGINLTKASIAEIKGDPATSDAELINAVTTGSQYSPEALINLVEKRFQDREAVQPGLPDLTASYATEYRNTGNGADLRRAKVIVLALAGRFIDAFEALQEIKALDGRSRETSALQPLLALLAEQADDVTFLRFSLSRKPDLTEQKSSRITDTVAQRLLELGFPGEADLWAASTSGQSDFVAHQILRAKIALAMHLPQKALHVLAGQTDAESTRLRALAMWQTDDYQKAGELLATVGDQDGAARGFWMAGQRLLPPPVKTSSFYTQVIQNSDQLRFGNEEMAALTPLANARSLVQASGETREDVTALLQNTPIE